MIDPAHKLKHCGVRIYSVGVGYNFDIKQLERMSSRPVSENVFIGPFNKLQYIRDDLVKSVCYGKLMLFYIMSKANCTFKRGIMFSFNSFPLHAQLAPKMFPHTDIFFKLAYHTER